MSRCMFGEMLDAPERFAALLATVLVGRHGIPPVSMLREDMSMVRGGANSILQRTRIDAIARELSCSCARSHEPPSPDHAPGHMGGRSCWDVA